jgi:protein-tyrosine-phosphatase
VLHSRSVSERLLLFCVEGALTRRFDGERFVANREYNVLFLCTGNSARSVMAECAINRWGKERFKGYSAGSHPKGSIHPLTLELLNELDYETSNLRSKSWDEFALPDSPQFDFVFTVCDQAAAEQCPVWPGHPITTHWGVGDPAAFEGTEEEKRRFFSQVYRELENRVKIFTNLPIETLDSFALQQRVEEIGMTTLSDKCDESPSMRRAKDGRPAR